MQNQKNVYNLIIDPKFKIWRHLALITGIFFIAVNNVLIVYDFKPVMSLGFFISTFSLAIAYLSAGYINIYFLIPKFLLRKKYISFILCIFSVVVLLEMFQIIIEYLMYLFADVSFAELSIFQPYNSFIPEFIFFVFQLSICIMGIASVALLKQWIKENQNITHLKNEFLRSEVEQLKGRISPQILFKILNNTAKKAEVNPEEASATLVKLSHVLRYQLYDCSRDKVLMKSEVAFIENYLELLKMNNYKIEYDISLDVMTDLIFVPPLLFISLLQILIDKNIDCLSLKISLKTADNHINFICEEANSVNNLIEDDFRKVNERMRILYGHEYLLSQQTNQINMKLPLR